MEFRPEYCCDLALKYDPYSLHNVTEYKNILICEKQAAPQDNYCFCSLFLFYHCFQLPSLLLYISLFPPLSQQILPLLPTFPNIINWYYKQYHFLMGSHYFQFVCSCNKIALHQIMLTSCMKGILLIRGLEAYCFLD